MPGPYTVCSFMENTRTAELILRNFFKIAPIWPHIEVNFQAVLSTT